MSLPSENNKFAKMVAMEVYETSSQFHNHAQYVQTVCLAGHTSCKHGVLCDEGRYCLKCIIIDIFILYLKKYLHSFVQSAVFTGRVARQINH